MDAIKAWFAGNKDYHQGVALYASLSKKNTRVLKMLNRGKTNRNMSVLVSELRKAKNTPPPKEEPPKPKIELPNNPTQDQIETVHIRKQLTEESQAREFETIRIGDLPEELRPRYVRARNIFYKMIELKFSLNDLPDSERENALQLQIKIIQLDEERDVIWKELHHWKKHRSLLPVPDDDFSGMRPNELWRKKRNLEANISKISKRVDKKYLELDRATDRHNQLMIESSIRKSESTLHEHRVNLEKIKKLL